MGAFRFHTPCLFGFLVGVAAKRDVEVHSHVTWNRDYPSYTIDLDKSPEDRWAEVAGAYRDQLPQYFQRFEAMLVNTSTPLQLSLMQNLSIESDYMREMKGFVEQIDDPDVSLRNMVLFNTLAELVRPESEAFASSISVLAATPNGTVVHGRNLNFWHVSPIIDVTFTTGGQPLFNGPMFVGQIILNTGIRFNSYAISTDTRYEGLDDICKGCDGEFAKHNNVALNNGGVTSGFTVRSVLEHVPTFKQAVKKLASVHLAAPMYYTVSGVGPWEGAVLTRDRIGRPNYYQIVQTLSPQIGRWYFIQANTDFWRPSNDGNNDLTQQVAGLQLRLLTSPGVCEESILNILRHRPPLTTSNLLQWVSLPAHNTHQTWLGPSGTGGEDSQMSEPNYTGQFDPSDQFSDLEDIETTPVSPRDRAVKNAKRAVARLRQISLSTAEAADTLTLAINARATAAKM